jgi:hypothetical protein
MKQFIYRTQQCIGWILFVISIFAIALSFLGIIFSILDDIEINSKLTFTILISALYDLLWLLEATCYKYKHLFGHINTSQLCKRKYL